MNRRLIKLFADWNGKQAVGLHCLFALLNMVQSHCLVSYTNSKQLDYAKVGHIPLIGAFHQQTQCFMSVTNDVGMLFASNWCVN